jgi:hypothetical protein
MISCCPANALDSVAADNQPILRICCASAAIPKTSTNVATKIDDQPAFFIVQPVTEAITQAVVAETITYGRIKTGFAKEKKG